MPQNAKADNLASALPKIWLVEFYTLHNFIPYFLEALEQYADGVRGYEPIEDSGEWLISLHFNTPPDINNISAKVDMLHEAVGLPKMRVHSREIENKNWVEEIAKEFKAIRASKFYIYSQFSEPSNELIDIKINPGMAFGTGQHETTYLCLEAITHLENEGHKFKTILDLGTGSGILAIAAHRIWPEAIITATDNDPIAVRVAAENAVENNAKLNTAVSEGFATIKPQKFDLILANILMNPLLDMAEDLNRYSASKAVLSGFKTDQVERIMEKYGSLGFKSERMFVKNHWVSLLLAR